MSRLLQLVMSLGMAAVCLADEPMPRIEATHVVVKKPEKGRALGWPANGGLWSWGDEILVMYADCPYVDHPGFSNHDSDQNHPNAKFVTSRSFDGGQTWTEHRDAFPVIRSNRKDIQPTTLRTPIDFASPDTIISFHWDGLGPGHRTYFYVSTDQGRNWVGPFDNLPLFDLLAIAGRSDYQVTGKHGLTAYLSATERSSDDCFRESVYAFSTDDGGVTWKKGPRISRALSDCGTKYRGRDDWPLTAKGEYGAMPSTVRLDERTLVSAFRSGDSPGGNFRAHGVPFRDSWIDLARSTDNGRTWKPLDGRLMRMPGLNGSPPALDVLPDGRLVCSWGYRLPDDGRGPTGIEARISEDGGETWGDLITLRRDGFDYDIGYTVQTVRPDGKILTVYYYRTKQDGQSPTYIAATIWSPPPAKNKLRD